MSSFEAGGEIKGDRELSLPIHYTLFGFSVRGTLQFYGNLS